MDFGNSCQHLKSGEESEFVEAFDFLPVYFNQHSFCFETSKYFLFNFYNAQYLAAVFDTYLVAGESLALLIYSIKTSGIRNKNIKQMKQMKNKTYL